MVESRIIKFRANESLYGELERIHQELGYGDFSDTLRLLMRLGLDVYSERQKWKRDVVEAGSRFGFKVVVT